MSVLIETLPQGAAADTLPVVKLSCWYGSPVRGEVYSYARICMTGQGLRLVLTVFDGNPPTGQRSCAALGLGKGFLWLYFTPDGCVSAEYIRDGKRQYLPAPDCVLGRGSDEQGWYWQVDCTLTDSLIQAADSSDNHVCLPTAGSRFPVGFFLQNTQDDPACFGAAFADPAFTADRSCTPDPARCLEQAVVIAY